MLRLKIPPPPLIGLLTLSCSGPTHELGTTSHQDPDDASSQGPSEGDETSAADDVSQSSSAEQSQSSGEEASISTESDTDGADASSADDQDSGSSKTSADSGDEAPGETEATDGSTSEDSGDTADTGDSGETGATSLDCGSECYIFGDICFVQCLLELPPVSMIGIEDFDGDAQADLVFASVAKPTLHLWRGDGNGTFEAQETIKFPDELDNLRSYLRADVDGDGSADWLVEGRGMSRPHTYSVARDSFSAFGSPRELEYMSWSLLDLGGDDHIDIALGYWDSLGAGDSESGWELFAGRGDGGFDRVAGDVTSSRTYITTALAGDLDGDGLDDLVVQGWHTNGGAGGTSVRFGQGDGTLGEVVGAPYPENTSHNAAIGRFHPGINGVGPHSVFHVSGVFDVEFGVVAGTDDRHLVPIGRELELIGDPYGYEDPRVVRRNGAEVDDVVMYHTQSRRFEYLRNDGRSSFSRDDEVLMAPGWFRAAHWGMGDINGDGIVDYILGDEAIHGAMIYMSER